MRDVTKNAPKQDASARERILEVAIAQFSDVGFAAARVDKIARVAGVNKQLIYYYFGSKSGLRDAALEAMVRAYVPFWEAVGRLDLGALLRGAPAAGESGRWLPWRRLLSWEGVEYHQSEDRVIQLEALRSESLRVQTEVVKREQRKGTVPASLDPAAVSLLMIFARMGPYVLPQIARMVVGDLTDAEIRATMSRTLEALFARAASTANADADRDAAHPTG
jgi:AcrR family transcriptional regulator